MKHTVLESAPANKQFQLLLFFFFLQTCYFSEGKYPCYLCQKWRNATCLLRLCVCDRQKLKCWNVTLRFDFFTGIWLSTNPFLGGVLLPIFVLRGKYKSEHQTKTKNVFVKGNPEVYSQFRLSYTWLDLEVACGRFLFLSISPVRLLRAPSYKESSKSSQVESIYSMLCRWQECWPGRCVAVWVQRMLRWWVSWVQTQAGPLLTLRCLAFITQMGEGFS